MFDARTVSPRPLSRRADLRLLRRRPLWPPACGGEARQRGHSRQTSLEHERRDTLRPTSIAKNGLLFCWGDAGIVLAHPRPRAKSSGRSACREAITARLSARGYAFQHHPQGRVVAIAASDKFQLLGQTPLNDKCQATPAIVDGKITSAPTPISIASRENTTIKRSSRGNAKQGMESTWLASTPHVAHASGGVPPWLTCAASTLWHGLPARGLAVRREHRLWHGFVTRGLAVLRQHRSYSTDISKSAALFV